MSAETVSLPLRDRDGRTVATLRIAPTGEGAISMIAADLARKRGEASCQLSEGATYDYRLEPAKAGVDIAPETRVVFPHAAFPGSGRIDARNAVGLVTLRLVERDAEVASADVEIVSTKINYREQYRAMLADIVDHAAALILDSGSAQRVRFRPTTRTGESPEVIRAEFLIATVHSSNFRAAIERILSAPETRLVVDRQRRPIERMGRASASVLRQLTGPGPRRSAPETLRHLGLASVPTHIFSTTRRETVDIDENRFVKHVLKQFSHFLERYSRMAASSRLKESCARTVAQLGSWLGHATMQDTGALTRLPLGSPSLQRREGYRQLLGAWVMFNAVSELNWEGGADIFAAGRRDLAVLYEFWVFFQLLDVFQRLIRPARGRAQLIAAGRLGPELSLRRGEASIIEGRFEHGRPLLVRFSYNTTFASTRDHFRIGSWTRSMRPDFTFTIWPEELSLDDAERLDLSVHVHFDAKYRVLQLEQLLGTDEELIDSHDYNRNDLIKMHAYRDAIRRSYGAYVVYPGQGEAREFRSSVGEQLDEILPGLGAFPLLPGEKSEAGKQRISKFLHDVLIHATDRASVRERISYSTHHAFGDPRPALNASLGAQNSRHKRVIPPSDRRVLAGWCRGEEHFEWIMRTGRYNLRTGNRVGAVRPTPEWLTAEFLLLHGERAYPGLLRISAEEIEVQSRRQLRDEHQYPFVGEDDDLYLVLHVTPDADFAGRSWQIGELINPKRRAHPTILRFDDLLRAPAA